MDYILLHKFKISGNSGLAVGIRT